ncbi:hypothetical protein BKA63DRAFT_5012 [Paraphoma chrysanthemicola]|nr:hypothetical protein BKA63DRAFT_5012 [Paraphoma chrysanthemicola]
MCPSIDAAISLDRPRSQRTGMRADVVPAMCEASGAPLIVYWSGACSQMSGSVREWRERGLGPMRVLCRFRRRQESGRQLRRGRCTRYVAVCRRWDYGWNDKAVARLRAELTQILRNCKASSRTLCFKLMDAGGMPTLDCRNPFQSELLPQRHAYSSLAMLRARSSGSSQFTVHFRLGPDMASLVRPRHMGSRFVTLWQHCVNVHKIGASQQHPAQ